MGSLNYFNLNDFINQYGLDTCVETGLGHGDSIIYASSFGFSRLFSIEISNGVINKFALRKDRPPNIQLLNCDSKEGLNAIFSHYPDSKCLIFLDAHFPRFDVFGGDINSETQDCLKYPLLSELQVIKDNRSDKRDCIIIDDLMLYTNNDEQFPDKHIKTHFGIKPPVDADCLDKIIHFFDETHDCKIINEFSGYAVFTPKSPN